MIIYNYPYSSEKINKIINQHADLFEKKFGFDLRKSNNIYATPPPHQVHSNYCSFPFIFSPSFKEQYSKQIGLEIINKSGLTGICDNTDFHILSSPFFYSSFFCNYGETAYFDDDMNCYFFMAGWEFCGSTVDTLNTDVNITQCKIYTYPGDVKVIAGEYPTNSIGLVNGLFWVKLSFPGRNGKNVDLCGDFNDKNVKFEIIDYVPDKFPSYDNLSQPLKDKVEDITQLGFDVHYHFFDRAYDPNLWKKEMKLCYDAINKKLEARARRKLTRNKKENFPVETAEKCYFPDLTFNIRLKKAGSEGAAAVIEAAIMELGRNISEETGYGFEFISVDAVDVDRCELVIDFGMCETDAVDKVIDTLSTLGLGIEKVEIE